MTRCHKTIRFLGLLRNHFPLFWPGDSNYSLATLMTESISNSQIRNMLLIILGLVACAILIYLWRCNRAISVTPPEAARWAQDEWTEEQIWAEYSEMQRSPVDVRPYLFDRQNRRYIVVGGSGWSLSALPS